MRVKYSIILKQQFRQIAVSPVFFTFVSFLCINYAAVLERLDESKILCFRVGFVLKLAQHDLAIETSIENPILITCHAAMNRARYLIYRLTYTNEQLADMIKVSKSCRYCVCALEK